MNKLLLLFSVAALAMTACTKETKSQFIQPDNQAQLYSYLGSEYAVEFNAVAKLTDFTLAEVTEENKAYLADSALKLNVKFLIGPLTHRELGGMKLDYVVTPHWEKATEADGIVTLPYTYKGTWLVADKAVAKKELEVLPLPFDASKLQTTEWLSCTDSDPEHQTQSFYWYFWDPKRYGCDHVLDKDYQMISVQFGAKTLNEQETYPEYVQMMADKKLTMTYGFGYVTDIDNSDPSVDSDYGMREYRKFIQYMDKQAVNLKLAKTPITLGEYLNFEGETKQIGYRYSGIKNGNDVEIKVVAAAGIDQMDLFAKSYAHDHDDYFGWFGHSRVGSGFDANNFLNTVKYYPQFYSLSPNYQFVYWAGCNSYTYYTLPFFKQKAELNLALDPKGTKNLDILNNVLPSLFSFNAANASIVFTALINWEKPTSFQNIVTSLENYATKNGYLVIVSVLGDEDNAAPLK